MADTAPNRHPSYRWLRRIALGGMVAAASEASTPPLPVDALKLPKEPEKIVYVGMDSQLKQRSRALDSTRGYQFLTLLHGMPGLTVRSIQADGDARALTYPEDPIIPLPGGHFREPTLGAHPTSEHGDAAAIRTQLQADGFTTIAPLGFDLDGGDILYDAKRGLFLIGGSPEDVQSRAEKFHHATGHYAIPIPMTKRYAPYGEFTPYAQANEPLISCGLVDNPPLFYHLDTFANLLPNGELVIYPEATDAATFAQLKQIYGTQLLSIDRVEAERYITNFIASTDADGQSHVLLPAVSHAAPFEDHEPFHMRLSKRGYQVRSPESLGYHESHRYMVDLFDRSTDFPERLLAVLNAIGDSIPDRETFACLAQEQGLGVAEAQGRIIFRQSGATTRYWAFDGQMGEAFSAETAIEIERAKHAFELHALLREGAITEEAIIATYHPELGVNDCETMAVLPAYNFAAHGKTDGQDQPMIQGRGGIDCMTLDVLPSPSPQQHVFALLAKPTRTSLLLAQKIAKEAGFSFSQTGRSLLQIDYPNNMCQTFDLTRDFAENHVSATAIALPRGR